MHSLISLLHQTSMVLAGSVYLRELRLPPAGAAAPREPGPDVMSRVESPPHSSCTSRLFISSHTQYQGERCQHTLKM